MPDPRFSQVLLHRRERPAPLTLWLLEREVPQSRPLIVDLFCCQGGMSTGLHRAGFDVIGVDKDPQPNYPFPFVQMDALEFIRLSFPTPGLIAPVAVHASPPCQAHTDLQKQNKRSYVDLIAPTREMLERTGLPYTIENVEGAPLRDPVTICGASVPGVRVLRHRLFEANWPLQGVPCPEGGHPLVFTHDKRKAHYGRLDQDTSYVQVTGGGNATIANKRDAMGMPWADNHGCNEAVPPAYGEIVGRQFMAYLEGEALADAA